VLLGLSDQALIKHVPVDPPARLVVVLVTFDLLRSIPTRTLNSDRSNQYWMPYKKPNANQRNPDKNHRVLKGTIRRPECRRTGGSDATSTSVRAVAAAAGDDDITWPAARRSRSIDTPVVFSRPFARDYRVGSGKNA
jgi:hypothetical protein